MMNRLSWLAMASPLLVWVWLMLHPYETHAQDAPLFVPGQHVLVVYDCIPEWVTDLVSQTVANGAGLNPCYVESLTIRGNRPGGWIDVTANDGSAWTINSARILGFRADAAPRQAGR